MSADISFIKENIDNYLKEVAKQFRKLNGKGTVTETLVKSDAIWGCYSK